MAKEKISFYDPSVNRHESLQHHLSSMKVFVLFQIMCLPLRIRMSIETIDSTCTAVIRKSWTTSFFGELLSGRSGSNQSSKYPISDNGFKRVSVTHRY